MGVVNITDESFDEIVLRSELPVLLDASAEWCQPCKHLSPIIDQLSEELNGKMLVGKVDIDDNPDLVKQFRIKSVPTVLLIKDGKEVGRSVGLVSKEALMKLIGE